MTTAARAAAACALLGGPVLLAFFSGGFFDQPRIVSALAGWGLVGLAALVAERPLPRSLPGRLAVGGLALLTAWTLVSIAWAPLGSASTDDAQRALLYVAAFVAASAFLVPGAAGRAVEPALAAGSLLVMLYALSERLLPDLVELDRSLSASARLEQPLTYWNAMGALGAIGFVACARLAGDPGRPRGLRAAAAAACAPLGAGIYLTFSRGALAALVVGLLVLALLAPGRAQVRALVVAVSTGLLAALACGILPWVRSLDGGASAARAQGLVALAVLTGLAAVAAWVTARWVSAGAEPGEIRGLRRGPQLAGAAAAVFVAAILLAAVTEGRPEVRTPKQGASSARLVSADSNRYDYWRVALLTFGDRPFAGKGAGGFRVEWLRERRTADPVQDAHSLYLETAAELGVVGLAALAAFLAGLAACIRRAWGADPAAAAGLAAVVVTWAVHAGLDWDWEMPAVTLLALLAGGALVAAGDRASQTPGRAG